MFKLPVRRRAFEFDQRVRINNELSIRKWNLLRLNLLWNKEIKLFVNRLLYKILRARLSRFYFSV